MVKNTHIEIAVIGAGSAGLNARRAAEKMGMKAILIDPGPFGTTCARVGCMPSKLLIAASDAAHTVQHAGMFGIDASLNKVDGKAVMKRVKSERDRFVGFVVESVDRLKSEGKVIEGRASFKEPGVLTVEGFGDYTYDKVIIATGSSPSVPPPYRHLGDRMIFNDHVFDWDDLPESVLVVGAGVIGLELGQSLSRLGVDVKIIGIDGVVGPLTDPALMTEAEDLFRKEFPLLNRFDLEEIKDVEGGIFVKGQDASGVKLEQTFEFVLMAAGRSANLRHLGLETLGIKMAGPQPEGFDPDTLQIGEHPIFLAGDVAGIRPLLHEAADEGKIAGRNAARYPECLVEDRRTKLSVVFSDPQIAMVGERYADLEPCQFCVGVVSYTGQGRARVMGENKGSVRIYGECKTGRLVGAEMLGPRMEHMAHLLAWAIQQGLTAEAILGMPFYHPVFEEGIRTALQDLQAKRRRRSPIKCRVEEVCVGS